MSNVPNDMYFEGVIRPEQNNKFLLDSLCERFTYHNREDWIDKLQNGFVSINGEIATLETIAHTNDKIVYHVANYTEPPVPTHFSVVFDDEEFMLVSKPAGSPVHHTGHIFYNTFTAVIRRETGFETATPMHRLDRDTGGLMLFAKYAETAARFQKNLDRILLRKFYLAIVEGDFPVQETHCELPLRELPEDPIRVRMHFTENGKECHTVFKKLKTFTAMTPVPMPQGESGKEIALENGVKTYSLIEAELITGRKHQIRAHLSEIGYPIVGDRLYSHNGFFYEKMAREGNLSEADFATLGAHHQMLYAYKAEIQLPYWNEPREFKNFDFPEDMKQILSGIEIQ